MTTEELDEAVALVRNISEIRKAIATLDTLVAKCADRLRALGVNDPVGVVHGKTCPKVRHLGIGYLHADDDDTPYDVDGSRYCGRCHEGL